MGRLASAHAAERCVTRSIGAIGRAALRSHSNKLSLSGTLPGTVAGQSRALLRYLGKIAESIPGSPLYPLEPISALAVDEVCDYIEDIWATLLTIKKQEAVAAEMIAPGGKAAVMLDRLEAAIKGPFVLGDQMSVADVYIFAAFGWWGGGYYTSKVNANTLLASRNKLTALIGSVGQSRRIQEYYTNVAPKSDGWNPYRRMYADNIRRSVMPSREIK